MRGTRAHTTYHTSLSRRGTATVRQAPPPFYPCGITSDLYTRPPNNSFFLLGNLCTSRASRWDNTATKRRIVHTHTKHKMKTRSTIRMYPYNSSRKDHLLSRNKASAWFSHIRQLLGICLRPWVNAAAAPAQFPSCMWTAPMFPHACCMLANVWCFDVCVGACVGFVARDAVYNSNVTREKGIACAVHAAKQLPLR